MSETRGNQASRAARAAGSRGKPWRGLLTGVGVAVLLYLVYRMGWRTIVANITHFGGWFAVILLVQMGWVALQAASWYIIQNSLSPRAPFLFFVRIKIISDTMNTVLPTANLGGDAMRAYLVKPRIPLKEGVPGILVDKTVESIAGTLFMAIGILIAVLFFPMPRALVIPALACLLVLLAAIALLVFFQFRGFYRSSMALFGWIPPLRRLLRKRRRCCACSTGTCAGSIGAAEPGSRWRSACISWRGWWGAGAADRPVGAAPAGELFRGLVHQRRGHGGQHYPVHGAGPLGRAGGDVRAGAEKHVFQRLGGAQPGHHPPHPPPLSPRFRPGAAALAEGSRGAAPALPDAAD